MNISSISMAILLSLSILPTREPFPQDTKKQTEYEKPGPDGTWGHCFYLINYLAVSRFFHRIVSCRDKHDWIFPVLCIT